VQRLEGGHLLPSMPVALTGQETRKAARAAISVIESHDFNVCLFGSAACAIYGMDNREPNDVDLVVFANSDPEDIKDLIVSSNDKFYLIPSANPQNTYHVLWYSLPARRGQRRSCKVDILVPGLLSIPNVPPSRLMRMEPFEDIPVMPFLALLLLKLRGWTDHLADTRRRMREKATVDEEDIDKLLELAVEEYGAHLDNDTCQWMPGWFVEEAVDRVKQYVDAWPDSEDYWSKLGFPVGD